MQLQARNAILEERITKLVELEQKVSQLNNTNASLMSDISSLQMEMKDSKNENQAIQHKLESAKKENDRLELEKKKLDALETEHKKVSAAYNDLNHQYTRCSDALRELQSKSAPPNLTQHEEVKVVEEKLRLVIKEKERSEQELSKWKTLGEVSVSLQ